MPFLAVLQVFCFTPEEVARHLPACLPDGGGGGRPMFDVVLFDEASQLPTYEALGCLGRARQCIVVGDDQQLPPRDGCTGLLDDALLASMALVPLTWHYRSAFASLIHVSNEMFYHGSLQCVPSANDFLAAATGAGAESGAAGLVRVAVSGPMESNYNARGEIEEWVNKKLARLHRREDGTGGAVSRISYTASPQGFVNSEQAWRVLEELTRYMDEIRADGRPLSCGIITLNRPQRQLIHLLVGAASDRLGLVDAHNHCFTRPEGEADGGDQGLFIQSIDQIQGEERELILFSMLLAPRQGSRGGGAAGSPSAAADDPEGFDIFDRLEAAADADPAVAAAAAAGQDPAAGQDRSAAPSRSSGGGGGGGRQRFQYSTIAHAHGDRLLNVGLSRAVSMMKVTVFP